MIVLDVKDKDKPENRQGAAYKIKCCDCQPSYIGKTGRNLSTLLTEQTQPTFEMTPGFKPFIVLFILLLLRFDKLSEIKPALKVKIRL